MKINYKIDYISATAAHFTTFPQTEQSSQILARNRDTLSAIADRAARDINQAALRKLRDSMIGGGVDLSA